MVFKRCLCALAGCSLQVKSYLAGNPPIKIKLNDDLLITRRDGSGYSGGGGYGGGSGFSAGDYASDSSLVILDDVNFHEVGVIIIPSVIPLGWIVM
jgi:hypothetical protein